MLIRLLVLFIGILAYSSYTIAQISSYTPLLTRYKGNDLLKQLDKHLELDINRLPKTYKKRITTIYEDRTTRLKRNIRNEHYLFGNAMNRYVESILNRILVANPAIPQKKIRLLISRYIWPNASCLGEGTFVINIGLIRRLENEDQLAFVICHELAHYMENHVNNAIKTRIKKTEALKKSNRLKTIEHQEYGRYEAFVELLKGLVYDDRSHSRLFESEADALGMEYFLNAQYEPLQALRCMNLLDQMDEDKYPEPIKLASIFDSPEFPFQEKWMRSRKSGLSKMKAQSEEDFQKDSLKTHPDCKERYQLLKTQLAEQIEEQEIIATKKDSIYQYFIYEADFELVQSCFDFGYFGRCLLYACQLHNKYPENAYIRSMIGRCLHEIYLSMEDHDLIDYVPLPSNQKGDYKKVLQFIHNLRISELQKVNYYFLKKDKDIYQEDEDYLFTLWLNATLLEDSTERKAYKELYYTKFKEGKYWPKITH